MNDAIDPSADYPIEEVAALKGVSYATVRSAIVRGELAANTSGRVWLVRGGRCGGLDASSLEAGA